MRALFHICIPLYVCINASCNNDPYSDVDCSVSDLSLKIKSVEYADCGLNNGSISVEANNGFEPYQYKITGGEFQSSPEFTFLRSNIYTVQVTDAAGCIDSTTTFVGSGEAYKTFVSVSPSGCNDNQGKITVTPQGGVPPFIYQLGENANYQEENYWEGLRPGEYSVWVKDDNVCAIGIYVTVPSGVSYSNDVEPIISNKCIECHSGAQSPDLSTSSNVINNSGDIKNVLVSGDKDEFLSQNDIDIIVCWLDDNSPNN